MNLRWTRPLAGLALVGALTTGCPSPSIYGTARTIPQGTIQHTLAAEVIGAAGSGATFVYPTLPTYQMRIGLADNVDLGLRLGNLTMPGADVKINFVRGAFDLAIMPGVQAIYGAVGDVGGGILYLNLPLVLGFNLSRNFSLIATPGVAYGYAGGSDGSRSSSSGGSSPDTYRGSGFIPRLGVGANIRLNNTFSIQPEFTGLYSTDTSALLFTFGLGFVFGAQPDFSDIQ
ncbi:MAG: hypothetical protein KA978_19180 [Deltaproteobacteria bacterium]|jgi:hypothetical protein|nr:hypothetical protein [Deltaproteobacteria bacterium]